MFVGEEVRDGDGFVAAGQFVLGRSGGTIGCRPLAADPFEGLPAAPHRWSSRFRRAPGSCRVRVTLGVVAFDARAPLEAGAGSHGGDEMGAVDCPPPVLGGLDEFEGHGHPGGFRPGTFGHLGRRRTVAMLDSMGLVVLRWIQCSAGKS